MIDWKEIRRLSFMMMLRNNILHEDKEDIVQDTITRMIEMLAEGKTEEEVENAFPSILKNKLRNSKRAYTKRVKALRNIEEVDPGTLISEDSTEEIASFNQATEAIYQALLHWHNEKHKKILSDIFMKRLSYQQVAKKYDEDVVNIRKIVSRFKNSLCDVAST